MEPDDPGQSEAVPSSPLLEPRESYLLSVLYSTIEVLEGLMEVSQSFLRCTLRGLVHPWELCFLKGVEELVLLHSISESVVTLIVPVLFDPLVETPVVGKTSNSCMLSKVRPLDVVGIQFIPVGSIGQHSSSVYGLAGSF